MMPTTADDGQPAYEVRIPFTFAPIFSGILGPKGMASPTRVEKPIHGPLRLAA